MKNKVMIWTIAIGLAIVLAHNIARIFFFDRFTIPSESMIPILVPGDRILVNKTIFGARIYTDIRFGEGIPLSSVRTKGSRNINPGDVVVFNAPFGYNDSSHLEFKINYAYCKRCVGCPGDSVSVIDGIYHNSRFKGIIGTKSAQQSLSVCPDSLVRPELYAVYPYAEESGWNLKNLGPIYIPKAGDKLLFDNYLNIKLYAQIVEYETASGVAITKDGELTSGGEVIREYTTTHNYYYMCGDNVFNSRDSRYLGFVPEEFIIGVATRVLYSRGNNGVRCNRLFKKI